METVIGLVVLGGLVALLLGANDASHTQPTYVVVVDHSERRSSGCLTMLLICIVLGSLLLLSLGSL